MYDRMKKAADFNKIYRLEKRFKTTFIGAISAFEKEFGRAWGSGLPKEELTEKQLMVLERWERVRDEILTNGNNQLRAAKAEMGTRNG